MEFIHEIGWLFHRNQLKSRLGHLDPNENLFSLPRFKWLMEFSMDHDWCAVVKKLLDILQDGTVDAGGHPSLNLALMEMGLLHRAVRKNSRSLVELLLRYPSKVNDASSSEDSASVDGETDSFLFRPNVVGPAGLTPLHIAAGKDDSEDVLDALTNDPGMVRIFTICFLIHGFIFSCISHITVAGNIIDYLKIISLLSIFVDILRNETCKLVLNCFSSQNLCSCWYQNALALGD